MLQQEILKREAAIFNYLNYWFAPVKEGRGGNRKIVGYNLYYDTYYKRFDEPELLFYYNWEWVMRAYQSLPNHFGWRITRNVCAIYDSLNPNTLGENSMAPGSVIPNWFHTAAEPETPDQLRIAWLTLSDFCLSQLNQSDGSSGNH